LNLAGEITWLIPHRRFRPVSAYSPFFHRSADRLKRFGAKKRVTADSILHQPPAAGWKTSKANLLLALGDS